MVRDVMNSKSGSGPSGISDSNVSRSMTTADVVTKMDREPSPPPR